MENKKILNILSNELKSLIKDIKNGSINKYFSNLTTQRDTEYSLWWVTKRLKYNHFQLIKRTMGYER